MVERMKNDKKTLHLVLKKKWWDMIESGVKTEEYRDIKQKWVSQIMRCYKTIDWCRLPLGCKDIYGNPSCSCMRKESNFKHYDYVCFHKGYTANTMTFEVESISVGKGNPEWGAPKDDVFIIKLGKRV